MEYLIFSAASFQVSVTQQKKEPVIAGLTRNRLIINSVFCSLKLLFFQAQVSAIAQTCASIGLCSLFF